jgi:hypothetical protein
MADAAWTMWEGVCLNFPYERLAREKFGGLFFDKFQSGYEQGTVGRSQFILSVIGGTFPTTKLHDAYFDNLEKLLKDQTKRAQPGDVVLGVGTGRCGSTTLTMAVAQMHDTCSTHEIPPLIFWDPVEEQVRFHFERLRLLTDYFALVFDASHWWLNVLGRFFAEFPAGKVVGLHRDTEPCVRSFLAIKGRGPASTNHWAPPGNTIWLQASWDPTYPSYPLSTESTLDLDAAKAAMIERYVSEYNQALRSLAETNAGRLHLMRIEDLNDPAAVARLGTFLGGPISMPVRALNVGGTLDSEGPQCRL